MHRGSQSFSNIRFYDEREWRLVPELGADLFKYLLNENQYNDYATRKKANREIQSLSRICFYPSDIKYIIIARENEIPTMIKKIEEIGGDLYTQNKLKVMCSKIISAQRIAEDF